MLIRAMALGLGMKTVYCKNNMLAAEEVNTRKQVNYNF